MHSLKMMQNNMNIFNFYILKSILIMNNIMLYNFCISKLFQMVNTNLLYKSKGALATFWQNVLSDDNTRDFGLT